MNRLCFYIKFMKPNVSVTNTIFSNWQMNSPIWRPFHTLQYLIQSLACKYFRLSTALDTVLTVGSCKRYAR